MDPIIRVASVDEFLRLDLNGLYPYAISIREAGYAPSGVLRPDYRGTRLNLYFDDVTEGETKATPEDIAKVFEFSLEWREVARRDPFSAPLIVHCTAGVSRSAAVAMVPLSLWYGEFRAAARRLFSASPNLNPNPYILRLVEEWFDPYRRSAPSGTIFEAVREFHP